MTTAIDWLIDDGARAQAALKFKEQIQTPCEICGGKGYIVGDEGIDYDTAARPADWCVCRRKLSLLIRLMESGLPREFWQAEKVKVRRNKPAFAEIRRYIDKMENAVKHGLGLIMLGENGVGKTTASAQIVLAAIRRNMSVLYITFPNLIHLIRKSQGDEWLAEVLADLVVRDVMIIDELGKEYKRTGSAFVDTELDRIVRNRRGDIRPTIIISNYETVDDIEDGYGKSLVSVLLSRSKPVQFAPGDYRDEQAKEFDRLLGDGE